MNFLLFSFLNHTHGDYLSTVLALLSGNTCVIPHVHDLTFLRQLLVFPQQITTTNVNFEGNSYREDHA